MIENNLHRKKQYSRMIIRKSFLELLESKPLNKITVKDICEKANVNRTTFYSNYYDIYDLLSTIEGELYEKITNAIRNPNDLSNSIIVLEKICLTISENPDICRVLFGENGNKDFISKIMYLPYGIIEKQWKEQLKSKDSKTLGYIYEYVASGSVGVIKKWVENDFQDSPQEIALLLNNLTKKTRNINN